MFYNPKEYLSQDLRFKGPMRRRYNEMTYWKYIKATIFADTTEANGKELEQK